MTIQSNQFKQLHVLEFEVPALTASGAIVGVSSTLILIEDILELGKVYCSSKMTKGRGGETFFIEVRLPSLLDKFDVIRTVLRDIRKGHDTVSFKVNGVAYVMNAQEDGNVSPVALKTVLEAHESDSKNSTDTLRQGYVEMSLEDVKAVRSVPNIEDVITEVVADFIDELEAEYEAYIDDVIDVAYNEGVRDGKVCKNNERILELSKNMEAVDDILKENTNRLLEIIGSYRR